MQCDAPDERGELRLTVLGSRGSMPVSQKGREVFGGATSCYMVQAGEDCVFLDAGTGLLSAPTEFPRPPLILVTHLHLDHILGLGMYRRLVTRGAKTLLCLPGKDECEMRRQFDTLFSPPYWPLSPLNYEGELELVPARFPMRHGSLCIESAEGQHPGGSLIFRVSCGEKSLVYATDFEHERGLDALARFAEGTDLLLYDGQYSEEEYSRRRGFGHSTEEKGLEVMERCGAKRLLLIRHAPESTDRELQMPIWRKADLTVSEAVLYSGIGENTLRGLLNSNECNFAFKVGNKYLINRELFETYIKWLCTQGQMD